ncbi:uncharacterized protein [Littorina saxatilis]|uniref:uncharacterized protein n=1 Tax=Littorina saxatilis TaxID=31220 RepID=UPI0038B4A5A0
MESVTLRPNASRVMESVTQRPNASRVMESVTQRPNASRVMESVTLRLCELHPVDTKRPSRWSLILRDYSRIRHLVLNNARVMEGTRLQLADINQATLTAWDRDRIRRQEREVLEQGLRYQAPPMTASQPLPRPNPQPESLEMGNDDPRHEFVLPENTAGKAKKMKRKKAPPVPAPTPGVSTTAVADPSRPHPYAFLLPSTQPDQPHPLLLPLPPSPHLPHLIPTPARPVPATTDWYRKRRLEMKERGEDVVLHKRRKEISTCKQCGKDRLPHTHKQYYGAWWCEEKSSISHQDWLQQQKESRTVKKKQPSATVTAPPE